MHLFSVRSTKIRLAITLYFLASTAEYRTIANLFGVSPAFVCICVKVCQAVWKCLPTVVCFPEGENLLQLIQCYEEQWGFPMCAGAIDGTHIPVLAPSQNHIEYVNRKGQHSIVVQAVVDCYYLFRDIVVGWPRQRTLYANFVEFRHICKGQFQPIVSRDTKQITR